MLRRYHRQGLELVRRGDFIILISEALLAPPSGPPLRLFCRVGGASHPKQLQRPPVRQRSQNTRRDKPKLLAGLHGVALDRTEPVQRRLRVDVQAPQPQLPVPGARHDAVRFWIMINTHSHAAARARDCLYAVLHSCVPDFYQAVARRRRDETPPIGPGRPVPETREIRDGGAVAHEPVARALGHDVDQHDVAVRAARYERSGEGAPPERLHRGPVVVVGLGRVRIAPPHAN